MQAQLQSQSRLLNYLPHRKQWHTYYYVIKIFMSQIDIQLLMIIIINVVIKKMYRNRTAQSEPIDSIAQLRLASCAGLVPRVHCVSISALKQ